MLWIALVAVSVGSPASDKDPIDIRALPTLVVHWERSGTSVEGLAVDDGVAYARAWRDLEAIEIASGQTLWKHSLDHRIARGPVLLDDRLAVIVDESTLVLVDRFSGVVTATRPLRGKPYHGSALAGPPLVAAIQRSDDDGIELLRLDPITGHLLDRLSVDTLASLESFQGTTLASFETAGAPWLVGLRDGDLTPRWKHPVRSRRLHEIDGQIVAALGNWADTTYVAVDPDDGALRALHGERPGRTPGVSVQDLAWDLQVVGDDPPVRLRRLDADNGRPRWERPLPCSPSVWTRDDGRLVMHCRPADQGRGLLLVIDLETGAIRRRAPGFHGVSALAVVDDVGLTASRDGLFAFSLTLAGPKITETSSIENEVDAILAPARCDMMTPEETAADLRRIGSAALPLLAERLPGLELGPAQAAATVLGEASYSPAAGAVAERLRSLPALGSSTSSVASSSP